MSTDPQVSAVMVSYRTGPILFAALEVLLREPGLLELVLVDNGNPPEVRSELRRLQGAQPKLRVVEGQGNVGFAKGCNLGARSARGRLLLLLNPDCILPDGGLAALLAEARDLGRRWVLGCRLLGSDGREQAGARRRELTPRRALVEGLGLYRLARLERVNLHQDPVPAARVEVEVTSGACMLLPREDYWWIGGMDEGYFLHVEDIDFCVRWRQAGGRVYFTPRVASQHAKGSSRASPLAVEWHKMRGLLRYFRQHRKRFGRPALAGLAGLAAVLRFFAVALLRGLVPRRGRGPGRG